VNKNLIINFFGSTLLCIFSLYSVWAQDSANLYRISGKVTEGGTEMPLTAVTVYLDNTAYFSVTGLDGSYSINNIPSGSYQLKASFIGFDTYEKSISLDKNYTQDILLSEKSEVLEGVVVTTTRDLGSDVNARADERKADNVINIISARSIELSPDLTVANITQRVSGVSLERNNNGDGQHAIVRGMDKRYNYTLVNGIKIPSPDNKNRYIPLDIFPADLLDRLVVTKSLLPNMEGDAIGGVIDMKMKDAPGRMTLQLNIGTGYNTLFNQRPFMRFDRSQVNRFSPNKTNGPGYLTSLGDFEYNNMEFTPVENPINQLYSFSLGNRFFNNKLGVIVAASHQNTYRGANSMFMSTFINQENNTPYYEIMEQREFSTQQARSGFHTKVDYKINENNKINLYAAFVDLQEREIRSRVDTILKIGRGQGPGTGRVELRERSRQRIQRIYNTTLQGEHKVGQNFTTDWSLVYSLATFDDPDMVELLWQTGVSKNVQTGQLQYDPILYGRDFTRRWTNNSDQDLAAYLNTSYLQRILGLPVEFSAGGMYRHKNRENFFDTYLFRSSPIRQERTDNVRDYTFNLFNNIGTPTDPLNYTSIEDVLAAYAMFKFQISNLQVMGGVRNEYTYFEWETQAPPQVSGRVGSLNYNDVLPSLHFKYMPDNKTNVRASYFASISRPNFFEVIPYDINEEDFRERGNPDLQRTQADNFDFRIERFPTPVDQIMVGFFYKRITNPIESALLIQGQSVFLQPNNFGTATNLGIEVDYTRYFKNFGIRAFYTFTDSEITTTKIVRFRDAEGNLTSRNEDQTRPLQGQSRHIGNAALLYKNPRYGWDMQVAMVYTGDRIISVSPYLDNDIWQRGFVQLDFSADKSFKNGISLYLKINNILNTPLLADIRLPNTFNAEQAPYLDSSKSVLVREDFYWQTLTMGIKYKLQ
jgi:outer membrane cobalamin receptor